jgi:hypothetical protein
MTGIIFFLVALFAMFGWFAYLFATDPANLFKRRPPPGDDDTKPSP